MSISVALFKVVDVLCYPGQNYKEFKGITVVKDIPYGEGRYAKGDVYFDEKFADKPYPVIIQIHGGGFSAGDKACRKSLSSYYASKGWFVYNINYRLAPKAAFPAQAEDAMLALNFIPELAKTYNLDLDKIVVTGDSAGGYSAAFLCALTTNEDLCDKLNIPRAKAKLAGFMGFCGPYDIAGCLEHPIPFGLTRDIARVFLGFKLNRKMDNLGEYKYVKDCAPINFFNEKWPPAFISMAGKDFFCMGQGERMVEKYKEYNIPVMHYASTKFMDNHCFHLEFFKKQSKLCMAEAFKYLETIKNA